MWVILKVGQRVRFSVYPQYEGMVVAVLPRQRMFQVEWDDLCQLPTIYYSLVSSLIEPIERCDYAEISIIRDEAVAEVAVVRAEPAPRQERVIAVPRAEAGAISLRPAILRDGVVDLIEVPVPEAVA